MKRFSFLLLSLILALPFMEGCRNGPTSANGGTNNNGWTQVTASAPWAARYGLTGTVYNGNMWIMGGASGSGSVTNYYGDVWKTSDGKNWTQTLSASSNTTLTSTTFGPRYNPQVVTFANGGVTQLYLIGGNQGGNLKNDVWTSTNGSNWTQVLANNSGITKNTVGGTQFCPRQDFSAVVFNNLIYVIGGADVTVGSDGLNDVWSSPDGINWTQVLAYSAGGNTQFAPRWGAAAVSFNNNLYVMCGFGNGTANGDIEQDVWSSANGAAWNQVDAAFGALYYQQLTVNNNEMWTTGGDAPWNGGSVNMVETSTTGSSWSGQGAEPFGVRFGHLALSFNGNLWIIGGCDNNSSLTYYNDVWEN